jgi:hypothetical protein
MSTSGVYPPAAALLPLLLLLLFLGPAKPYFTVNRRAVLLFSKERIFEVKTQSTRRRTGAPTTLCADVAAVAGVLGCAGGRLAVRRWR